MKFKKYTLGDIISKEQKDFPKHEEEKKLAQPKTEKEKQLTHEEHKLLAEAKSKELEDMLKRLQAEFENYQKRTAKEYVERMDLGKMELAKSMLNVADEFEHALNHLKGEDKKGMEMIFHSFMKSLAQQGIRPMDSIGKKYDPYNHDVITQQTSDKEDGIILAETKKGYFYKDKVLRHAEVVISKKKSEGNKCVECEV